MKGHPFHLRALWKQHPHAMLISLTSHPVVLPLKQPEHLFHRCHTPPHIQNSGFHHVAFTQIQKINFLRHLIPPYLLFSVYSCRILFYNCTIGKNSAKEKISTDSLLKAKNSPFQTQHNNCHMFCLDIESFLYSNFVCYSSVLSTSFWNSSTGIFASSAASSNVRRFFR